MMEPKNQVDEEIRRFQEAFVCELLRVEFSEDTEEIRQKLNKYVNQTELRHFRNGDRLPSLHQLFRILTILGLRLEIKRREN